jgi:hypothetical protein
MSSKGIALAVLKAQKEIFSSAAPMTKITPMGTLAYLLAQSRPSILSQTVDNKSGYIRDVNIRYRKRASAGESVTDDDCSLQSEPAFYTQTLPSLSKRFKGIWFDMPTIKTFTEDALAGNSTTTMVEVMDAIMNEINGLLLDINTDLVSALTSGINLSTGLATAKTVNFTQNTTNNVLTAGMTGIMADIMLHEASVQNTDIIGAGLINNYMLQQRAKGVDQSGVDTSGLLLPSFWYDPAFTATIGANNFVVVEKNAMQFVNVCYNRAGKISGRFGTSEFGTIQFPITDAAGNSLGNLEFDIQFKEEDCPGERVIAEAAPAAKGRGMSVIVGCHFALAQVPATAYKSTDRMYQVNGVWKYAATNA